MKAPVSIIVLTFNEEVNIQPCLKSVKDLTDEIFVLDSFSTDRTLELAREYTPNIFQNAWVHWAHQRNWALDNLPITNEWVCFLDADERLSEELSREIADTLAAPPANIDGYYIKRNFYFLGRWIKHGGYQSDFILRLIKRDKARSIGSGAREYVTVKGELGRLKNPMIHEDRKDIGVWIDKHNKLAKIEAMEALRCEAKQESMSKSVCTENTKIEHSYRIWLREKVWARMPLFIRPFVYFIYRYICQLGFLDGKEGFLYFFMHGLWFNILIDIKYLELKKMQRLSG
jgi:glycosyltransferase involved in cell wall biosynthesis